MSFPIALLRDDFTNNTIDPLWAAWPGVSGSATRSETVGQARITLPSSTAGTHENAYYSAATYDLTGDSYYWNIDTMVATGVAAYAFLGLQIASSYQLRWFQQSNTIKAQKIVGGVVTDVYSATWSSTTYKYLRIRESGGNILFDSSTNGTSWTNRHTTTGLPIAITALYAFHGAGCGNVASPGTLRIEDVNLILPAPSSTWRYTTGDWSITNRLRPVTLASDGGKQGVLVTADTMDSAGVLGGTVRYFAGPLGSSSGGYLQATEYASLALAQASAFQVPTDGRVDLPAMVDARYMRLYHRSTDASAHTIREFVPRRLVQAEDVEAESIRAINIAAGAITADKIDVINLSAITANIGQLTLTNATGAEAWIYQGTGTGDVPITGLKLYNSGGVGRLVGYNTGAEQVVLDTDGRFKWAGGVGVMDATGIVITSATASTGDPAKSYKFAISGVEAGGTYGYLSGSQNTISMTTQALTGKSSRAEVVSLGLGTSSGTFARTALSSIADTSVTSITLTSDPIGSVNARVITAIADAITLTASAGTTIVNGLNVGSATAAATGQISTSGSVGVGVAVSAATRLYVKGQGTTSATFAIVADDSGGVTNFYIRNDKVGFLNNTAWTYSSDATKKRNIRPLDKDILDFMKLEPKRFDYIDGPINRYGYIAQDVQAIMPDLVEPMPDGSLGMRTDELLPLFNHVLRRLIRVLVQKNVIGPADIA